jgi:hypothetical protein
MYSRAALPKLCRPSGVVDGLHFFQTHVSRFEHVATVHVTDISIDLLCTRQGPLGTRPVPPFLILSLPTCQFFHSLFFPEISLSDPSGISRFPQAFWPTLFGLKATSDQGHVPGQQNFTRVGQNPG